MLTFTRMYYAYEHVRALDAVGAHHNEYFQTKIAVVHERAMLLFGLEVVRQCPDRQREYVQCHFFKEKGDGQGCSRSKPSSLEGKLDQLLGFRRLAVQFESQTVETLKTSSH